MATKLVRYESVSTIRAMVGLPCKREQHAKQIKGYCESTYDRETWHGMAGGAIAVMSSMMVGFPEGEAKIDAMQAHMIGKLPKAVGIGRKLVRGMSGDELDIHAVNRGDTSRAWSSRQRLIKKGVSALKVIVDIAGNCNSSHDILQWRGIAGVTLSEIMTKAGYSTEIVAAWAVRDYLDGYRGNHVVGVECVVKARGVTADRGLLAATLCLTGFFRTVGFAAIARAADDEDNRCDTSLGNHVDAERVIPAVAGVTNIYVPASICDEASAVEWIKSTVELLQSIRGVK
jgi:hypothetical protein